MALGRVATGHGDEVGLLLAIKLNAFPRTRAFIEGALETFFHKALTHSPYSGTACVQGIGDLLVGQLFMGFEQNPSPGELASRRVSFSNELEQLFPLLIG